MTSAKKNTWGRRILRVFVILLISHLLYAIVCRWINPPITITQASNWISGYGLQRDYIRYEQMGSSIKYAVLASEDQSYLEHEGIDMEAIEKAMEYNEKHANKRRGGSTISQQTAKNVFLWQGGGYFRKGLEAYFTMLIETCWNKQRIYEVYLNVLETGPGIFGVEAAANAYFNKSSADLTEEEAAMIAACLPNPKKYTVKPMSRFVRWKSKWILRQMRHLKRDSSIKALVGDS